MNPLKEFFESGLTILWIETQNTAAFLFLTAQKSLTWNILTDRSVLLHESSACGGRLNISPIPSARQLTYEATNNNP